MSKISVVMALYNTDYTYLEKTVKSILNQTFADFEFIIVDDASSMDYKPFFEHFKDSRIKYIKLENNGGPGKARNEGIKIASGEYVAIADSDDVYMPDRLKIQADFLDKNPEISIIGAAFKFSNNGKIPEVITCNDDIKIAMMSNSALANPLVMFRRNVFMENDLLYPENINFAEDYELWINAMFRGIKFANLQDVLMIYTRRKNQLSKIKSQKQSLILKDLYKKIFLELGFEPSENELELHKALMEQNFIGLDSKDVAFWFDKIVEQNKNRQIFCEDKIINLKKLTLEKLSKEKQLIFKIKIGQHNLCLYKPLRILIEKRD